VLRVDSINVAYGRVQVLFDISLHVDEGEIVVLLGANGGGKSTTLKSIAGVLPLHSGTVEFLGKSLKGLKPSDIVRLGMTRCLEERGIFTGLSVRNNLEMGAFTIPRRQFKPQLHSVYDLFPVLLEKEAHKAGDLSGGQQQMLSIGRALMSNPKLLLLDEPSLGLAPIIVQEIPKILRSISERGVTVLLVEQNTEMALDVADRAYILQSGRIVLEGTVDEMQDNDDVRKAYLGG
jgi:branched-chain amino acid transport system ATP-binding protein